MIESLLEKVDILLLGGGMIFTFYKAQGLSVGSSLVEEDKLDLATSLLEKAKAKGVSLLLPSDVVIADKFAPDANSKVCLSLRFVRTLRLIIFTNYLVIEIPLSLVRINSQNCYSIHINIKESGLCNQIVPASAIPDGWMGLDIGPDSIKTFNEALDTTKTIIWNGPMGVFEFDKFAVGTEVCIFFFLVYLVHLLSLSLHEKCIYDRAFTSSFRLLRRS